MADFTPQHYEVYLAGDDTQNPLEQAEKQLEEQRRIIIKGMDDDLRSGTKYEQIKGDLKYDVVGNIGIAIYKGEPNSFYKYTNGRVEYYTNLPGLKKIEDLPFALRETGYDFKDGILSKNGEEVTQFLPSGNVNPEFVKAIENIDFYSEIPNTFGLMKGLMAGDKIEFDLIGMYTSIVRGVMRIKDVMYFASNRDKISLDDNGARLSDDDIKMLLRRAIEELPKQCSDTRFYQNASGRRMGMEVTKQELDEYLNPTEGQPLITQAMYDDCLRRIEIRDKKINYINGVKEGTKGELKIEGTKAGIVQKVLGILGIND